MDPLETMAVEGLKDKLKENDNLIHTLTHIMSNSEGRHLVMVTWGLVSSFPHTVSVKPAPSRTCMDT